MKNTFLSQLTDAILNSGIDLSQTAIVLPNKRAQRMFLKVLAEKSGKPIFAPTIFSINDFIAYISPLEKLDRIPLLIELYNVYKDMMGTDAEDFDKALAWMPAFVDDMSEVEKQMDDGVRILTQLSYSKDFELSFGFDKLSEEAERKRRFYNMLSDLYVRLKKTLLEKKQAYDGLLYRDCAENIEVYQSNLKFEHFVFAGFHVLNPAELSVVAFVKTHFDTHFYFDIDPFYCDFNKKDRFTTAHFLRKICRKLSLSIDQIQFNEKVFEQTPKRVRIVGTSKVMNQIYYAISCLEEIKSTQGNLDDTALVLADEQLLPALLAAYDVEDANVTMGYPFTATPAYALLSSLIGFFQTGLGLRKHGTGMRFHRRDVLALLHSPLIKNYLFDNIKDYDNMVSSIEREPRTFFSPQDLEEMPLPYLGGETKDLLANIIDYLNLIQSRIPDNIESNDRAIMELMIEQLRIVHQQLQSLSSISLSVINFAVRQSVGSLSLPIRGDATTGLQIMGLLETRTLDFKNVIMLSVNEGVLPAGIRFNSILPFDFKFHDETLENYLYKDHVYAYHFFRLLQRAENVVILYDNDCSNSLMEKSRFVTQLEFEVRERHLEEVVRLSYPMVNIPYSTSAVQNVEVKKDALIMRRLEKYSFSASGLNTYINCPLQFYWSRICNIEPPVTFKERIESNIIGTVVHAVFEHVLCVKEDPHPNFNHRIDDFLSNLDENIKNLILNHENLKETFPFHDDDLKKGRVYLALCIISNHVRSYLSRAKEELAGVTVLANELELECTLKVEEHDVRLHGFIDRLQYSGNHVEVIDYKTGKVEEKDLRVSMDKLPEIFSDPKYAKFVQLFFYALICKNTNNAIVRDNVGEEPIQAAIISIPDANTHKTNYIYKAKLSSEIQGRKRVGETEFFTDEYMSIMESELKKILSEILNPKKPFVQTKEVDHCRYCDFKHLCNR